MTRITISSNNPARFAGSSAASPGNAHNDASVPARPAASPPAARGSRPPAPHATATRHRLAATYAESRREFDWAELLVGYAVAPVPIDLLSMARCAPGGVHGRDMHGKTLVEAVVQNGGPTMPDLLRQLRAIGADLIIPDEEGNTLLHRVVMAHDVAAVELLLNNDVDVNAFNRHTLGTIARYARDPSAIHEVMQSPNWFWGEDDNATPLHLAAAFGNPALIRLLLSRGANVDTRNRDRLTPLHWAVIFSNNPQSAAALIAAGARVNGPPSSRCTPLHSAAMGCSNENMIYFLLDRGADLDAKDDNGQSVLHRATFNAGNLNILAALLARGADLHAVDDNGVGVAETAVFNPRPQTGALLALLKTAGADLEAPDRDGNTMLHRAALYGEEAPVRALLMNGVDVNALNRRTNPDVARYAANPEAAAAQLRHPNLSFDDTDTATPMHLVAATGGAPNIVKALVEYGADINLRNAEGCTPLHWAAMFSSSPAMVRVLLEQGADIRANGYQQMAPLHAAATHTRNPDIITALIEGGADVNARTEFDTTPLLHAALCYSEPANMRTLLLHGADTAIAGHGNMTPLHLAATMEHADKVLALIEAGADINAVDESGHSPLFLAETENADRPEIARLLIAHGALRHPESPLSLTAMLAGMNAVRGADDDAPRPPLSSFWPDDQRQIVELQAQMMALFAETAATIDDASERTPSPAVVRQTAAGASSDRLVQHVERWYGDTDQTAQADRARAWRAIRNEPHAEEFTEFLAHLHETAEYRNPRQRPDYLRRVAQLLTSVQNSTELRQQCFLLVEDATTSCGDRIGLTLNNLDMARIEHEAEQGQHSARDLINIRTSQFRIQILGEVALQKIAMLRPILRDRLDEIEVIHGAITLVAEELNLIGVSRTMLYGSHAHFSDADKRAALALIAQRESRGEYVKFIAEWQPWQKQLRRLRPSDFADLDQRVANERDSVAEQPDYTSDNDYVELCRRMENMQRERLAFSLENWTREWLVRNR